MAHLSAAVSVVTTMGPGGRCGVTASAVCSVTDAPPTLLVCLNRTSAMRSIFELNGRLCVNVLGGDDIELAKHFSGMTAVPMAERFTWPIWDEGRDGLPVLKQAIVSCQGVITDCKEVGSHSVMFVELSDISVHDQPEALVYFGRQFHRVRCAREADSPA